MAQRFKHIGGKLQNVVWIILLLFSMYPLVSLALDGNRNMKNMTSLKNNHNVSYTQSKMPVEASSGNFSVNHSNHSISSLLTSTKHDVSNKTDETGATQTVKSSANNLTLSPKRGVIALKNSTKSNKTMTGSKNIERKVKAKMTIENQNISNLQKDKQAKKLLISFFHDESETGSVRENSTNSKVDISTEKDVNHSMSAALGQSEDIEKRTNLALERPGSVAPETRQLQPTNQNNQMIETMLPSGSRSQGPQHVRINNQPTHISFKPVHKYYPAIHRYMTQPIHRYLNKPLSLNGLISSENNRLVTQPELTQSRQEAAVSLASQNTAPVQLQDSPTTRGSAGGSTATVATTGGTTGSQGTTGGTAGATTGGTTIGAVATTGQHPVPGNVKQVSPVRVFLSVPPRMQPVLLHPHKISVTGYGPCSTNPCKNGAICSSVRERAVCICRPGFRGQLCDVIEKCYPNPCHNFGSCTEIERDFQCTCRKDFRGKRCEVENKCEPNPCVNGGTCSEIEDDYVCTCRKGFFGHSCEVESKCGPINPCKNGATCQEARNTYKCFCRDGFTGYNCEARQTHNHCFPNPCVHGGFCTVTGTSTGNYTCNCRQGWKGRTCSQKVDNWGNTLGPSICESVNPCMFGGKCTPISYYDYTCACPPGRAGIHCERNTLKKQPSHSCMHCHAFARCLKDHCKCNQGYEGDGKHCLPVKQYCHPNPCYNGGTCRERSKRETWSGGRKQWSCNCPSGYSGENCQDMDLCHAHVCQNGGQCISAKGEARCICKGPYKGKYCAEKDVCYDSPCQHGGTCKDIDGIAMCFCIPEYDGTHCERSKCAACDHNANCEKGMCTCKENYIGDGKTCREKLSVPAPTTAPFQLAIPVYHDSPVKFCSSNPCASGATCLEAVATFFCQCPEDKFGKKCDQTKDVITDLCSQCDPEATCRDGRCVCNEGFVGSGFSCKKSQAIAEEQIAQDVHKTDSSCDFCPENGQCLNNICVCPPGFKNVDKSCAEIDVSSMDTIPLTPKPPGAPYIGMTRNRLPIGQWKEDSVVSEYKSLGCWADTAEWRNPVMRAMDNLEGLHPSLNDDYKKRQNPITKCASAAKAYGYKVFAVQNGGQCFSGKRADQSYETYGPSVGCRFGVGGTLSNDVYQLP